MTETSPTAIVLAAGQGTRMKSAKPKVLHELCGRPMLHYVIDAAFRAGAGDVVVVVGHGRELVEAYLSRAFGDRVKTAVQAQQRGTGDAVRSALGAMRKDATRALILCGDGPLLESDELAGLAEIIGDNSVAMITADVPDPTGYGRILRDDAGAVRAIVEHKDATPTERETKEINPGVYLVDTGFLRDALASLEPKNAQGELYLTDIVARAAKGKGVASKKARTHLSFEGINDRAQLAAMEETLYARIADEHRRRGVTIRTSARVDASVTIEEDATIEHFVVLRGATTIGRGARVDVGSVLTDVKVAAGANLKPYSIGSQSSIGEGAQIGPFSHLRPDSEIHAEAHIGNFVETKKTIVRRGAKANHLAYLGDGDVGENANIGAGTIFCNYDGFKKHKTTIERDAFIGSDSQIVAPVTIGAGAYVGTGTTVTKDVPADALAIGRAKQENKEGYASRLRGRMKAAASKK